MATPKGILIDMGNTLVNEAGFDRLAGRMRILELAHNPHGVTLDDYEAAAEELLSIWANRDQCQMEFPVRAFNRLVYERFGLTFDIPWGELEIEFWRTAVCMDPAPGVADALTAMRGRGLRLAVVSNSSFTENALSWELNRHGLLDNFAFVMSSADYGVRKPHPSLFRTAAAKLGCDPAETWFVGDSLECDIVGAHNAGMTPVWYNPRGLLCPLETAPVEMRHWAELLAMLDGCASAS
jgi:putative hydrolase of the HAD superfamily